jgi:hypothetical protein
MVGMIPWAAILKHAPAILASTDALLSRVRADDAGDRTRSVDAPCRVGGRLSRVRSTDADMAQQINALTLAHDNAARMARRGLALGITGLVLAIAGVILAIVL